jgi:hypothetical protein
LHELKVQCTNRISPERIADILSAYDDLIENNRRRMALLEEAARQLYREWFVRLRFPGHEHTRFTDGLPEGWQRRALETLCVNGDGIQTSDSGSFRRSVSPSTGLPTTRCSIRSHSKTPAGHRCASSLTRSGTAFWPPPKLTSGLDKLNR